MSRERRERRERREMELKDKGGLNLLQLIVDEAEDEAKRKSKKEVCEERTWTWTRTRRRRRKRREGGRERRGGRQAGS
eukprot:756514-Hanusia_phi.AAC.2